MSTAMVSAFYDVDEVLLQNRVNSNMTRSSMALMNMEPRKITGNMTNMHQSQHQQQPPYSPQQNQFRNRTGSISSTSSLQSDQSGYSYNSSIMGSPSSSTSSMISSLSGGSMPSSPVDYRKLDRSVSEPLGDRSSYTQNAAQILRQNQEQVNKQQANANVNSSRYKTELCRPFEENGYCKYGDKCQFAHGAQELRSLNRHPKYKTELCRTYHTVGFCPYGPRCHFIHNDEERRLSQQKQAQQAALSQAGMGASPNQSQVNQLSSSQPTQIPQQMQAQPHLRPKSLNFNLAMMQQRGSTGSTSDSPPSSISTDSPTMSPTFFGEDLLMGSAFSPLPPASAPVTIGNAFNFQDLPVPTHMIPQPLQQQPPQPLQQQCIPQPLQQHQQTQAAQQFQQNQSQQQQPSMLTPLNVQTDQVVNIAAQLQALTLANQRNNNLNHDSLLQSTYEMLGAFPAPPSPPESLGSSSTSSDSIIGTCGSPLEVSRSLRLPIFSKLSCSDDSD